MTLDLRLRHDFGGFTLDVEFAAPPGVTVLYGRSGSGKSSVINAVAGLFRPDRARIRIADRVLCDTEAGIWLPPRRRGLGYIFQDGRLFPHMTVRQNLVYGMRSARRRSASAPGFDHVVGMLGLGGLLARRPAALSGGEKQRVAIGRALLADPALVLADEPLAALDEPRKAEILPYFERLRDEVAVPVLYVSHAPAEVARLATTVVALQDGRVVGQGTAAEVLGDPMLTPAGIRAAGAVLEAVVRRHHADGLTELDAGGIPLFLPGHLRLPGATVRVRIAAQEVIVARARPEGISALNVMPGVVEQVRSGAGPGAIVSIRTDAGRVLARITRRSVAALGLAPGTAVHAIVKTVAVAPEDIGGAG